MKKFGKSPLQWKKLLLARIQLARDKEHNICIILSSLSTGFPHAFNNLSFSSETRVPGEARYELHDKFVNPEPAPFTVWFGDDLRNKERRRWDEKIYFEYVIDVLAEVGVEREHRKAGKTRRYEKEYEY